MIDIKKFPVTYISTNCYLITDVATGKMAVIDAGGLSMKLLEEIEKATNRLEYILLTHGHFDHIGFVRELQYQKGGKVVMCADEEDFIKDEDLNTCRSFGMGLRTFDIDYKVSDGDVLYLGETKIKVIQTPGHTKGSVCYIMDDCIFSGDTLFCASCGRTDLPTGDVYELLDSLKRLSNLEGNYRIFPGHGKATTLNFERANNRALRLGKRGI